MKKLRTTSANLDEHRRRGKRFGFLKRRLDSVDIPELWKELEADLSIGRDRRDVEVLGRALDVAESNLRRSGMLARVAVEELEEFSVDWRRVYGEWEMTARSALEVAKREKRLSGMTTAEMVENWVAKNVADYARWKEARRELERSVALTRDMNKAWENRAATLRKMADLIEPRRGVHPGMVTRGRREGEEDAPE